MYQEVGFVLQRVWKRREGKERHQGIKGSIHSGVTCGLQSIQSRYSSIQVPSPSVFSMSNSLLVSLFPKSKQDQHFQQCTSMSMPNNIFFLLLGFIANIQPGYQSPPSSPLAGIYHLFISMKLLNWLIVSCQW